MDVQPMVFDHYDAIESENSELRMAIAAIAVQARIQPESISYELRDAIREAMTIADLV